MPEKAYLFIHAVLEPSLRSSLVLATVFSPTRSLITPKTCLMSLKRLWWGVLFPTASRFCQVSCESICNVHSWVSGPCCYKHYFCNELNHRKLLVRRCLIPFALPWGASLLGSEFGIAVQSAFASSLEHNPPFDECYHRYSFLLDRWSTYALWH